MPRLPTVAVAGGSIVALALAVVLVNLWTAADSPSSNGQGVTLASGAAVDGAPSTSAASPTRSASP